MNRTAKKIPLQVTGAEKVAYHSWPVTQGVPFAEGELHREMPVCVVDEDDQVLPTQTSMLASWDRDWEYARWLLVDFQANLAAGQPRELFLEYGGRTPPEPEQAIQIQQISPSGPNGQSALQINTGQLQLELCTASRQPRRPDLFANCAVKSNGQWTDLFGMPGGPFAYMSDDEGVEYRSNFPGTWPTVQVEEAGPLRTCLCIKGAHNSPSGIAFCPYILRIHLFAGRSELRIYHTFIFDQDPHAVELGSVGMRFPVKVGHDRRAAVGGQQATHWVDRWQSLGLVQSDDRHYQVSRDGQDYGCGEKTDGWASLNGSRGSIVAVVRNAWQEYPKGFHLSPDQLDVQVWPEQAGPLTFTTPFDEEAIYFKGTRDEEEVRQRLVVAFYLLVPEHRACLTT